MSQTPNTARTVDEKMFTLAEQFELTTMTNDTRALARFLASVILRSAAPHTGDER